MEKRSLLYFGVLTAAVLSVFAWYVAERPEAAKEPDGRVKIAASFYPLADFAKRVGGSRVEVDNLTPPGVEPHDFEPSPRQVSAAYDSRLFIYNGGGIDAWASKLAAALADEGVRTLEMRNFVGTELLMSGSGGQTNYNEHFWLDPVLAKKQVLAIRDALAALDPKNAAEYLANADRYVGELDLLDREYAAGLKNCGQRTVVSSHEALGYLAQRYGFTTLAIAGLSPDVEPSAGKMAEIAKESKDLGVKYVFYETLTSPALAKALATELGIQTLVFDPIEGLTPAEISAGRDYLTVMRANLANLKKAMLCK